MMRYDIRRRGRPRGSGIPDQPTLERMADLLVRGGARNKTEAIRRLAGVDPSLIRRLQRKFKDDEWRLMADARARAKARRVYPRRPLPTPAIASRSATEDDRVAARNKMVRFFDDLPVWHQYGLTIVSALLIFWLSLEAIARFGVIA